MEKFPRPKTTDFLTFTSDQKLTPRTFLENQTDAFLRGDFDMMGNDYDEPILMVHPHGSEVFTNRNAFNNAARIVRDHLIDLGLANARLEIIRQQAYGDLMIGLDVNWHYIDRRGGSLGRRAATYVLRHYQNSFRIAVHVLHADLHEITPK